MSDRRPDYFVVNGKVVGPPHARYVTLGLYAAAVGVGVVTGAAAVVSAFGRGVFNRFTSG
jgi:hypothetical protein